MYVTYKKQHMKQLLPANETPVYPGTYVPLYGHGNVERVKQFGHAKKHPYNVEIMEEADAYNIDIAVPGAKSENFLVDAGSHEVNVLIRQCCHAGDNNSYELSDCEIILPEETDPDFILAHYDSGALHLYVPKMNYPVQAETKTIVVY